MKKAMVVFALLLFAGLSVSLAAAAPKSTPCGAWDCKGKSCAHAKYAAARHVPALLPLAGSRIYGAIAVEGGLGLAGLLAALLVAKSRRVVARHAERKSPAFSADPLDTP